MALLSKKPTLSALRLQLGSGVRHHRREGILADSDKLALWRSPQACSL